MRKLLLLLLLSVCLPAWATRIQDSDIRTASGQKINKGVVKICPPSSFASGSWWVSADCVTASIVAGSISITLLPATYRVHWQSPATDDQYWVVPDSVSAMTVADVVSSSGFPIVLFSPTLAGSGVVKVASGVPGLVTGTSTDCVRVDGTSGACGTGGGGGGEPVITAGTTSQYWRGDKSFQTLNTTVVPEGTNLYHTPLRVVTAMSGLYEVPLSFAIGWRSGNTITCPTASGSVFGCLTAADWTIFNGKQAAITGAPGTWAHQSTHLSNGSDPLAAATTTVRGTVTTTTSNSQAVSTDDARNTNARTPTAHATSHQPGGADEIATETPAINSIPKTGASASTLDPEWWPPTGVSPATYGDGTHVPQIVVDAKGRVTSASSVAISGLGTDPTFNTLTTGDGTAAGELRMYGTSVFGSEFLSWLAPDNVTQQLRFQMPTSTPVLGQLWQIGAAPDSNNIVPVVLSDHLVSPSVGTTALRQSFTNSSGGTTAKYLAVLSGSSKQVAGAATATGGVIGVCVSGCGTSGTAEIAIHGRVTCTFDNAVVEGDYVQPDGATGKCHDAGSSYPTAGGSIVGRVLETGAAGDREIFLGREVQGVAGGGGGGGGGGYYQTVQNNGVDTTQELKINFAGRAALLDIVSSVTRVRIDDVSTMIHRTDDFLHGSGAATGSAGVGEWGWVGSSNANVTAQAAVAGHPGIVRLDSSTSSGTYTYMNSNGAPTLAMPFLGAENFDLLFLVRTQTTDSNTQYRLGLTLRADQNPSVEGIFFEKLTSDTNWFAVTRSASTQSRSDSGLSASVSGNWCALWMYRKDASTIGFKAASTIAGLGAATEVTLATNVPAGALNMFLSVSNSAAASKQLDVDLVDLRITGLSR